MTLYRFILMSIVSSLLVSCGVSESDIATTMSDYEFCKMLDDSGDPLGTVQYVGETYFEGKKLKRKAHLNAQDWLNTAIASAVSTYKLEVLRYNSDSFISQCLKELKNNKKYMFESD